MLPVISPALEHLQVEVAGPSELTVYIWDSESTGAPAIVTGCDSSSPAKGGDMDPKRDLGDLGVSAG